MRDTPSTPVCRRQRATGQRRAGPARHHRQRLPAWQNFITAATSSVVAGSTTASGWQR
jgi:hypothetical protein